MATNNIKMKSIVSKPPVHPMNRPSQHQQASHGQTSRSASPISETISFGDLVNPDWSKEKRLVYQLQYFGHFDVDDEDEEEGAKAKEPSAKVFLAHKLNIYLMKYLIL
jgi:hypothetical protein